MEHARADKMNWLEKAWIAAILSIIVGLIDSLYDKFYPLNFVYNTFFLINGIALVVVLWYFLYKDAKQRKLSKMHGAWALLGIIGVAIYHFFFARKNKIKKS